MQELVCIRCGKPATIGEHDDAIGSFVACSDQCHAAELAHRTEHYKDDVAGVYERKRERIGAIRAGEIEHPGFVELVEDEPEDPPPDWDLGLDLGAAGGDVAAVAYVRDGTLVRVTTAAAVPSPLDVALARIAGRGAERLE